MVSNVCALLLIIFWNLTVVLAQPTATITINAAKTGARVSPVLHGIFFEEISHAGEGGLYAELIQNRAFEENRLPQSTVLEDGFIVPKRTEHFMLPNQGISDWKMEWPHKTQWPAWSVKLNKGSGGTLAIDNTDPLNAATPNALQVHISSLEAGSTADLSNTGFWGINVIAGETYNLTFYTKVNSIYSGAITASLQSADGTVLASSIFKQVTNRQWKKFSGSLKATKSDPKAKFVLSFNSKGTAWMDYVSLFPAKTFRNRANGLRPDLAGYIEALQPAFIRWPGGCYVEGINIESAPDWKRTIGPVEKRPGTYSPWGYWSSDGFGYHEYLQFCEDINAAALYVFNAGVSCEYRSGTFVPEDSLQPYVQNALDAIEYAIGPVQSTWGKLRAKNGHPKPFPLKYVEVGNEQHGPRYASRYNIFYDAIKAKYPDLVIMASMGIGDVNQRTLDSMRKIDYTDEHAYKPVYWSMINNDHFEKYKRGNWNMYVGEYATNAGVGAGNMIAALSDAVYIMAMERNSDLVKMSSYAPLLVNVNDVDWPVNLINFDASKSFARISYYVIQLMNKHRADVNIASSTTVDPGINKKASFKGGIGLATWDTKTAYKDIRVYQQGKLVYKSDFINGQHEWELLRGRWNFNNDSSLAQTADGAQQFAMLKDRSFETYTLALKAKKLDGYNAFIIPFAVSDTNSFLRGHIGSWINQNSVIEQVVNGYDVASVSPQVKLPSRIEKDRWYDIRLEVGVDTVKCFLNDTLLITYTQPTTFFGLAGKDEKTGELVLKVVNAAAEPMETTINLAGVKNVTASGTLTVLEASSATEENSFDAPQRFIPVKKVIEGIGANFKRTFPPFSISVLRIKSQ